MNLMQCDRTLGRTIFFSIFFFSSCLVGEQNNSAQQGTMQKDNIVIASEMRTVLDKELARWYPASIDTVYGGFFSDLNEDWQLDGPQTKMVVTQARHVWAASTAAMFYQTDNRLREIAAHGVAFLKDRMWDQQYGGYYDLVDREGTPITSNGEIIKQAYGNSFAVYGLSTYAYVSGDTNVLTMAKQAFGWLEQHSYDRLNGGYFQFMTREGEPLVDGYRGTAPKDYNSTIHLLEAFTQLYHVWPDSIVRERLQSLLHIVRDGMTDERGSLRLYFKRDWTPISYAASDDAVRERNISIDHISFGHDIETAYLMIEAEEALGLKKDETTLRVAKRMVDHVLAMGWDRERGGIYDGGYYPRGKTSVKIVMPTKEWWAQVEAFNALSMMADLFPKDERGYQEYFVRQWDYCKKYVIDTLRGGWYWGGVDADASRLHAPKGSIWKGNYHTSRGLINCIRRIQKNSAPSTGKEFEPVNKNATSEARALLHYLYTLKGKKIISGHQNYIGQFDTYPNQVQKMTGKRPALWGCDFITYYRGSSAQKIVDEVYKESKAGYIITLMWHAGRPQDDPPFGWKESIQAKMTDAEWNELITPGTRLHTRWMRQCDTIASYLKQLQSLGVPVLWRPYHENNGVWFWWGNRKGPNGSAKLYSMMYDRFVNYHHLNNLLWVWNTNAPRQLIRDEAYAYKDFLPELDIVDVLATDVYNNDYRQSHHDELVGLSGGKPVALGEVGGAPTPETLDSQQQWSWFMIWGNWLNSHNTPDGIRALYRYPRIVTHEPGLTKE